MLILKNKKIVVYSLIVLIGLYSISKEEDAPEDRLLSSGDSIVRVYMDKINNYKNISKYVKNNTFSFLEKIQVLQDEDEYPQGLCFTNDFVLISSYSGIRGELGKVRVFDKDTGEYLISLGMDPKSHLGGVAYDGRYIWVCNSSKLTIEQIPYDFVKQMVYHNKGRVIDIRNITKAYRVNNIPSCITYYNGRLWIATHSVFTKSILIEYDYNDKEDILYSKESYNIPAKVQGISFAENGRVVLSTSYGRKCTSHLKWYDSVFEMSKDVQNHRKSIELPPCSEGIVWENNCIYVLFESAGKKYLDGTDGKGKSKAPIDKILIIYE